MFAQKPQSYTHAEYFALEAQVETKYEYYQGHVVAMAGASLNHNRLVRNLTTALTNALAGKPCEAFSNDLRLQIEQRDIFTYPDVMVVCGQPLLFEKRADTITNPIVIIEVLSESTERYDRSDKFHAYWTLETLKEYVLINQYQMRVEYFRWVSAKEWQLLVFSKPEERVRLVSLAVELSLAQIYQDVSWESSA